MFCCCFFVIQGLFFIRANSPTYDEAMHVAAGYSYLATGDFRLEPENPPLIKEILALPLFSTYRHSIQSRSKHWQNASDYFVGQDFLHKSVLSAEHILALSRIANLFLGGSLVALIGWWAYVFGIGRAALLAMALACYRAQSGGPFLTGDHGRRRHAFHLSEHLSSLGVCSVVQAGGF